MQQQQQYQQQIADLLLYASIECLYLEAGNSSAVVYTINSKHIVRFHENELKGGRGGRLVYWFKIAVVYDIIQ